MIVHQAPAVREAPEAPEAAKIVNIQQLSVSVTSVQGVTIHQRTVSVVESVTVWSVLAAEDVKLQFVSVPAVSAGVCRRIVFATNRNSKI